MVRILYIIHLRKKKKKKKTPVRTDIYKCERNWMLVSNLWLRTLLSKSRAKPSSKMAEAGDSSGKSRWSLKGFTALVTGGTRGIGSAKFSNSVSSETFFNFDSLLLCVLLFVYFIVALWWRNWQVWARRSTPAPGTNRTWISVWRSGRARVLWSVDRFVMLLREHKERGWYRKWRLFSVALSIFWLVILCFCFYPF